MRFLGLALWSGAVILGACGGGEKAADAGKKADSTATVTPGASPATGSSVVAAAPITGPIHEIKMVGDAQGYHFEPANLTAKVGDGIHFVVVTGAPHNIAFDPATIPADSRDQLFANGRNMVDGGSPMLLSPGETWELSLGNLKPGTYQYHCTPHLAMGMKGEITVTP